MLPMLRWAEDMRTDMACRDHSRDRTADSTLTLTHTEPNRSSRAQLTTKANLPESLSKKLPTSAIINAAEKRGNKKEEEEGKEDCRAGGNEAWQSM